MRIFRPSWVVLSSALLLFMVAVSSLRCNGTGCSWAKDTDTRGLSRHHATCKFYQKSSALAMEKRRERRTKESIKAVVAVPHKNFAPNLAVSSDMGRLINPL